MNDGYIGKVKEAEDFKAPGSMQTILPTFTYGYRYSSKSKQVNIRSQ